MTDKIVFVIGPQRSGSTWIYRLFASQKQGYYLDRLVKENYFFTRDRPQTADELRRIFLNKLTGQGPLRSYVDVCSTYFGHPDCIARICGVFPDAKFVYTFRDPDSRKGSFEKHRNLHRFSRRLGGAKVSWSLFDRQARFEECEAQLREHIAPENLLRLEFSDLKSTGGAIWITRLAEFLDVEIEPLDLGVVNKGFTNPSFLHHVKTLLKRFAQKMRVHLLARYVIQALTTKNRRHTER